MSGGVFGQNQFGNIVPGLYEISATVEPEVLVLELESLTPDVTGEIVETSYTGEGGVILGPHPIYPTPVDVLFKYKLPIKWNVIRTVAVGFDSNWNIGDGEERYYRILGRCTSNNCESVGVNGNDSKCGSPPPDGVRFITIVSARNIADLCTKLHNPSVTPPVRTRIERIDLLTRPVEKTGASELRQLSPGQVGHGLSELAADDTCNEHVPVDFCGVPECLEYCLSEDRTVEMGAYVTVTESFNSFVVTEGGVTIGGSAEILLTYRRRMTGGITLSGGASVVSPHYSYIMDGGVLLSGEILGNWLISPLLRDMSGEIETGGSVWGDIVSPYWSNTADGRISIGGSVGATVINQYNPIFPIVFLSGTAEIAGSDWHYYLESQGGGVEISGSAEVVASYYQYEGTGGIELTGLSETVSSFYTYEGEGSISITGEATVGRNFAVNGSMYLSGSADIALTYRHVMLGGIELSGIVTGVESPSHSYTGSGSILMGGEAHVSCNALGTFAVEAGASISVFDLEVEFTEIVGISDLTIDDDLVNTDCGCTSLPLTLNLGHNLGEAHLFKDFIISNGIVLPRDLSIHYHSQESSWRVNKHFFGNGLAGGREKWGVLFDWSCDDDVAGEDLGILCWKFSLLVTRSQLDTGLDTETRLIIVIPKEFGCSSTNQMDMKITFNTQTEGVTLSRGEHDAVIFSDRIGLFKGRTWQKNPNLVFRILSTPIPGRIPVYDIRPIFPVIEQVTS